MTITLPPDLERTLEEEARKRGTTLERVVVDDLRERYVPPASATCDVPSEAGPKADEGTLLDFLEGYIGTVDGPGDLSKDTGKQFTDIVAEKHERIRRKWGGA